MAKSKKRIDVSQSQYTKAALARPAMIALQQFMSEPLEVYLVQDRFVTVNATKVWRHLFNVDETGEEHEDVHPWVWFNERKDDADIREILAQLVYMGYTEGGYAHISQGNAYLCTWLVSKWASDVIEEYDELMEMIVNEKDD